ncbi:hypothetical protein ACRAWD_20655 [Caulobacter segnis]
MRTNQPLAAVALYLETVREMLANHAGGVRLLRSVMHDAANETLRAGHIVRRLRDFVARGEVEKSLHDLSEVVSEASHLAWSAPASRAFATSSSSIPPRRRFWSTGSRSSRCGQSDAQRHRGDGQLRSATSG